MNKKNTVVFIMGPTASGKTDIIIELSKFLPIDIISVDSAMVYQGMNIGTGKPSKSLLEQIPHYLVDICDPVENYSVANFCEDANKLIENSFKNNRLPVLVGGTMMYFNCLKHGLSSLPAADENIRKKLDALVAEHGLEYLHDKLKSVDPVSAERIHPNDSQRIQRALEVYELTNVKLSDFLERKSPSPFKHNIAAYCVSQEKHILDEKIEKRFMQMLDEGLVDEVKKLFERTDLNKKLPSIRSINYRQIWDYLEGNMDYEQMVQKCITVTRQLAKRQFTWLRSWEDLVWIKDQVNAKNILLNELKMHHENNKKIKNEQELTQGGYYN